MSKSRRVEYVHIFLMGICVIIMLYSAYLVAVTLYFLWTTITTA